MKAVHSPSPSNPDRRLVVTLGKFDGVHLGHQAVIHATARMARRRNARAAALVLYPDPLTVLSGQTVQVLTPLEERLDRLRGHGADIAMVLSFTTEVAAMTADDFVHELGPRLGGRLLGVVVGEGFRFGANRSGTTETLAGMGSSEDFEVEVVPQTILDQEPVSSGRIRRLVAEGRVEEAAIALGRPFRLTGEVVHGAARGRDLGFPTANLALVADYVYPANGIYTVRVAWNPRETSASDVAAERGGSRAGVGLASVGVRPTFDHGARVVEVFLLDFEGDLYGAELSADFVAYQRPELYFDSVDALVQQMHADVLVARANLAPDASLTRQYRPTNL